MDSLLQDARSAAGMMNGELVVGDHDSVTLLGAQPQAGLRDYSRAVSKLFLKSDDKLEPAIDEVLSEIERFEARTEKKRPLFFRSRRRTLVDEYGRIVEYIEQMSLFFQLQQAQLLKEAKLLEKLSAAVEKRAAELERCIASGEKTLRARPRPGEAPVGMENLDAWYTRLDRRVEDLRVSHAAALQSRAQIELLRENSLLLLDRLSAAVSNTLPVWKNQMDLMLGVERLERRMEEQDRVFKGTPGELRSDTEGIAAWNRRLMASLKETAALEKNNLALRREFQEAVYRIERGASYESSGKSTSRSSGSGAGRCDPYPDPGQGEGKAADR